MMSSSASSSGAPASPSSQQPPLHFARSHTNCFPTTSSLTKTLSITITVTSLRKNSFYCAAQHQEFWINLPLVYMFKTFRHEELFQREVLFPPHRIDEMKKIFFQEIV